MDADWWVLVNTPAGWYNLGISTGWQNSPGGAFTPAHQGALSSMGAMEVLNISGLMPGSYTFYFGVDAMDGVFNQDQVWYGSVRLTVQE